MCMYVINSECLPDIYVLKFKLMILSEEPHSRPGMDEVAQRLEAVYVDIILSEVKGNLTLRQTQLGELQKEDKDYGA